MAQELAILYDQDFQLALGTLAGNDVLNGLSKIDASRRMGFRVTRMEYWIEWFGKTVGNGPIMIGWTPTKSGAQVELALEADPQGSDDGVTQQQANEPVFPLVMIPTTSTEIGEDQDAIHGVLNPKWSSPEGVSAQWWAFNMNSSALTTGTVVNIFCKYFGVWLRD